MEISHADAAAALRRLADLIEANPQMALPFDGLGGGVMMFMNHTKEEFAATVKAFGKGKKSDGGDTLDFVPEFPNIQIKVMGFKRGICEKVRVKRIVPAAPETVVPAKVIAAHEAYEVETEEYTCHPFLETEKANG